MKKRLFLSVALLLCAALVTALAATGAKDAPPASAKPSPGVEAAQALSTITGVAISPLLGVSAVGAWQYFKTPTDKRAGLPWFAQPWFWLPGLLLVALVACKDLFGATLPPGWKKPFDIAELAENKMSALVAAGAFVPLMAMIFRSMDADGGQALLAGAGLAAIDLSWLWNALLTPFAIAAFVVVWLVSHTINILILISPWGAVDAALKSARTFLLSTVAVTSFFDPWVGAVWALIIIGICALLAGWAFRLMIFGTVFAWDFGTFRKNRFLPEPAANKAFTARRMNKVPIRTYGRLEKNAEGKWTFHFRPWLVLPKRTLELPSGAYAVGNGLFYPVLLHKEEDREREVFTFPPRFATHEADLAKMYGLAVEDTGLVKGFKAFWAWLKELMGVGSSPASSPQPELPPA
jgi:hypothetical protein